MSQEEGICTDWVLTSDRELAEQLRGQVRGQEAQKEPGWGARAGRGGSGGRTNVAFPDSTRPVL